VVAGKSEFEPGPEARSIDEGNGDRIEFGKAAEDLLPDPGKPGPVGPVCQACQSGGVVSRTEPSRFGAANDQDIRGLGGFDCCDGAIDFPEPGEIECVRWIARKIEPQSGCAAIRGQPDVVGCEEHAPSLVFVVEIVPNRGPAVNPNPCKFGRVDKSGWNSSQDGV
jgi:hypothetical protein